MSTVPSSGSQTSSRVCTNNEAHPSHLIVVDRTWTNESMTHVTHIISCVNDPRSGEEVNHKAEFNIVSASAELSTAESMNIVIPSTLKIHHRPWSEIATLKVDRDIRSEAEVNIRSQIECESTPTPMIMEEDQSRGKLRLDGEQWIPLQVHRPSLDSEALNGLDQDSKNLLSSIFNDNARDLTLSSISEDSDDRRVIWNFEPNDIGSLKPPKPTVSVWYQGSTDGDEYLEETPLSLARGLFEKYEDRNGVVWEDSCDITQKS
ncbi:hypothetical protein V865_004242 [Kwoniella europaea PYCC6329]|uniref:Uncharacterized protein n=1 Tax=Kwoniella europaea PYCC6329 TaxID=1423913 RepID=A0AAX4KK67_9TREE